MHVNQFAAATLIPFVTRPQNHFYRCQPGSEMNNNYTRCHYDFTTLPWLTSPRRQLELQAVALGLIHLPPDEGYTFTHSHRQQEEVYIVITGSGQILLNGDLLDLVAGDIVRVSPETKRALKAGGEGMLVICTGAVPQGYPNNPAARYMIDDGIADYDDLPPWYRGNREAIAKNRRLQQRRMKAASRKTPEQG
jgi:Cupin domain